MILNELPSGQCSALCYQVQRVLQLVCIVKCVRQASDVDVHLLNIVTDRLEDQVGQLKRDGSFPDFVRTLYGAPNSSGKS